MWQRSRNDYRHGGVGRAHPDRAEFVNACTRRRSFPGPHRCVHAPSIKRSSPARICMHGKSLDSETTRLTSVDELICHIS
jgi:hypothetical protein